MTTAEKRFLDPVMVGDQLGITPGMHIADFGSGSGEFTLRFAQMVGAEGSVSAIDVREAPLQSITARAEEAGVENINVIRGNLETPNGSRLDNQSQDVVLLANVLYQSDRKQAMLTEAKRVLKPGGSMIIIEWLKDVGNFGPPSERRVEQEELRELATDSGFNFQRIFDTGDFHYGLVFTIV